MKAILIDPFTKTVTEVEYAGEYKQICDYIQAPLFTVIKLNAEEDSLFIDDEGWIIDQTDQQYFWWEGYGQMLAGRGLILGTDEEGDSIAPTITLEEVQAKVRFQNKESAPVFAPVTEPEIYTINPDGSLTRL